MEKKEYPECPESYVRKKPCRAAVIQRYGWGCTALTDTCFKNGRCPFYKTKEQYLKDERGPEW